MKYVNKLLDYFFQKDFEIDLQVIKTLAKRSQNLQDTPWGSVSVFPIKNSIKDLFGRAI